MPYNHPALESFELIHPGPVAAAYIKNYSLDRYCRLSELPILETRCAWCNEMPRPGKRKYCSDACLESAMMWCFPQKPATKMYVLLKLQDCTCPGCGEIFDEQITNRLETLEAHIKRHFPNQKHVTYHALGYGTGEIWQVDHIIPIFRGGEGVGLENIQVLCKPCHKKKTAREGKS